MSRIRFIAISFWLIQLCGGFQPAQASDPVVLMVDPLVQLSFDPEKKYFDPAPAAVIDSVAKARKVRLGKHWVFADVDDTAHPGNRYLIVAGFMQRLPEDSRRQQSRLEPDPGVVVMAHHETYQILGDADGVGIYGLGIPEDIVMALMRDYVRRLVRAWGGSAAVQQAIKAQWIETGGVSRQGKALVVAMREEGILNVCVYHPSNSGPGYCTEN